MTLITFILANHTHIHHLVEEVETPPHWLTLHMPEHWPHQADLLTWCTTMSSALAAFLVCAGLVYLLFGVYLYKFLVTLNGAIFGAMLGAMIGDKAGSWIAGGMVGAFAASAITFPLMKYAVAVMGGIYGAMLGAALWRTFPLPPNLWGAGALSGLMLFGLLSFILFRGSVMMYTSLQGSVMLIFGILGLIYKYQQLGPQLTDCLQLRPFILPMAIFIPTIAGLIYQQTQFAHLSMAGGGGGGGKH